MLKSNLSKNKNRFRSWEITDSNTIIKTTDKSFFEHHGTGIPQGTFEFWKIGDLENGEKLNITLIYGSNVYEAHFIREKDLHQRIRMFWKSDFEDVIKSSFPDYPFSNLSKDDWPKVCFQKISKYRYRINFLSSQSNTDDGSRSKSHEINENFQNERSKKIMTKSPSTLKKSETTVESWTIEDLIDSFQSEPKKKKKIIIPSYQRNLVWSKKQKKELIDSIKDGMPIGALLLYYDSVSDNYSTYHLVDGLQRGTSIKDYVENPTSYFTEDRIDDEVLDILGNYFYPIEFVKKEIVTWVHNLKGFSETDGYSTGKFVENLDEKSGEILTKEQDRTLRNNPILVRYIENLKKESDIGKRQIPVIIYHGERSNLPGIFEKINSRGTQLSKYQIFAATWSTYTPIKIANLNIIEKIKNKYDRLIDEGLEIDKYNPETFSNSEFNYFEYFFGLGKYLISKYKILFGNGKEDSSEAESIGFNIGSLCLNNDLKKMSLLPDKLTDIDINTFEKCLEDSVEITENILRPYLEFKGNSKGGNLPIHHSELQIASIIGKIFLCKYDKNFAEKSDWKEKYQTLKKNLPLHYIYDIIRGYWSGTGDSKALDAISSDRYETTISKKQWEGTLNEWFEDELAKKETSRINIKPQSRLFLKYLYTYLMSAHSTLSIDLYEIEHICPVGLLKPIAKELEGLPISCISNLCFLSKEINGKKADKTYYDYYKEELKNKKISEGEYNKVIGEIENLTLIKEDDLLFIKNNINSPFEFREKYLNFLRTRFENLKSKFYDLHNIKG